MLLLLIAIDITESILRANVSRGVAETTIQQKYYGRLNTSFVKVKDQDVSN